VLKETDIGGYIVAARLALVALSKLISFNYLDNEVHNFAMAISAYSMERITIIVQ